MSSRKSKSLMKHAKGKKGKQQLLEDADDYLSEATEIEDGVGKHRGGDPLKSLRFARRALDIYSQGLSRYPTNFDLAYNKARLELEIGTHPVLVKHLDVPLDEVLQQALSSHRTALGIDSKNADLLFNMSQLLTTIAEQIAEDDSVPDMEAIQYLEEALKYQSACFEIQKANFGQSHEQILDNAFDEEEEDGGAKLEMEATSHLEVTEQDEQWFSIVEPVTTDTLIDTVLAQLETLTTLCSIVNASLSSSSERRLLDLVNPSQVEAYSSKILTDVLPDIVHAAVSELRPREAEIELTRAIFVGAFLELTFRSHSISIQSYGDGLSAAFASPILSKDPPALLAQARAFLSFSSSSSSSSSASFPSSSLSEQSDYGKLRWNSLTKVQSLLTTASQLPIVEQTLVATTHGLRGDTSILLCRLSEPPYYHLQATSSRTQLLKNAEVFYRNAARLFGAQGIEWQDDKDVYQFRGAIVQILQQRGSSEAATSQNGGLRNGVAQARVDIQAIIYSNLTQRNQLWRRDQLQEMIEDGLVDSNLFTDL